MDEENYTELNSDFRCCGLGEIDGLSYHPTDPEEALRDLFRTYGRNPVLAHSHLVFTGAVGLRNVHPPAYSQGFAEYIVDNHLGTVVRAEGNRNPNSGRKVFTYVWALDHRRLRAWATRRRLA